MQQKGTSDRRGSRASLRAFGSLEIRTGGQVLGPKSLGGIKPRHILEILVSARGHPVTKDRLIELLWPDRLPRNPAGSLESHVSVLRSSLPEGPARNAVATEAGAYRLVTAEGGFDVDLDRFDRLIEEAGRAPVATARALLESAISIARGDVFEDEPHASWAIRLRERYRDRVATARLDAAEAALTGRDYRAALEHADRVRGQAPLNERAARIAMLANYGLGRQDAALEVFDRYRAGLAETMGLDPLPDTLALQLAILRHQEIETLLPGDIPRTQPGFRRLVEEQSAGLWWTTDADLRVTSVAGTALQALGATPEDFLDKTIPEIFPQAGHDAPHPATARAALLGAPSTFTAEWRDRLLEVHVEPVRNAAGAMEGVTAVAIDVTDRMLGEEALADVQRRLDAQYEGFPIPTYTWHRDGDDFRLADANEAGVRASAGALGDYLGRLASEIYRGEPDIVADLHHAFDEKRSITREMSYRIPDSGSVRDLRVTYVYAPPQSIVVHLEDLTERRQTEADLRASQSALRAILDHSRDAIVVIDPETEIVLEANRPAADLLGYAPEEMRGMRTDAIHPEEMPDFLDFVAAVESEGHSWTDRLTVTTKSGELVPVEDAASATVYEGRRAIVNLVRPLAEGRHADPSLGPRLAGRSTA